MNSSRLFSISVMLFMLCCLFSIYSSYSVVVYIGKVSMCLSVFIYGLGLGRWWVSVGMKLISRNGSVRFRLRNRNMVIVFSGGVMKV